MPSEAKQMLPTPTERPSHYRYLKEFRVEQCTLFPQHKCTQHRPFTCFNWHFPNQRRRRPVRKRDGTFNYSPDNYCVKFDETGGTCENGDDCPLLHRTAGDTERRYHLRYYKTCMCVYETDSRGFCSKNGVHCAFAHGERDKRPPVYDIRELQNQEPVDENLTNGPNQLDKERAPPPEDPKWQDANYVLVHYKTEACKKPPRLCRQGYACPHYHNMRDRRRSPKKFKYRSTPCPNVKHGDEWGEPTLCDEGDECPYCHTRTEQQFHPEIYKSSKCHDALPSLSVLQCHDMSVTAVCPRGAFCAFAHADQEMQINRNLPSDSFADILSNVLPAINCTSISGLNKSGQMQMSTQFQQAMSESINNNNNVNNVLMGTQSNSSLTSTANNNNGGLEHFLSMHNVGGGSGSGSGTVSVADHYSTSPEQQYHSHFGGSSTSAASNSSSNTVVGVPFGTHSFASAVSSYSNAASGSVIGNGIGQSATNHGGKFFEDQPKSLSGNGGNEKNEELINGPVSSNNYQKNTMMGMGVNKLPFDNLDEFLTFGENMSYSLFPSSKLSDLSRDDSPNTIDKELETDHFSGVSSKPVSIPGSAPFFNRERFPSGSSPHLTNSYPLGIFNKHDGIEHTAEDPRNNTINYFDFSPRQNSTMATMSPRPTSSSNGLIGGNGNVAMGPHGPVGSSQLVTNEISTNSRNGTIPNVIGRSDLAYLSVQTLHMIADAYRAQLDVITKALTSYKPESPHYACLQCKNKDASRTVVLVPCDHQALCEICAQTVNFCPLCRTAIRNRKQASIMDLKL